MTPLEVEIDRVHMVRTLEAGLGGETKILVLEGPEGIGKSVLLKQFARTFPTRSIFLQVSGASRWAYDPTETARNLAIQMAFLNGRRDLPPDQIYDDRFLAQLFSALDRKAKRENLPYFFILDGLEEVPCEESAARQELVNLLPFGFDHFRFLLSGDLQSTPLNSAALSAAKSYLVDFFTRDESDKYLADLIIDARQLKDIYARTRGIPGHLASLRRSVLATSDPTAYLAAIPASLDELYKLEWRQVRSEDTEQQLLLAAIAYELRPHSIAELASVLGISDKAVADRLTGLSFVNVGPDNAVSYESESFRRFAAAQLAKQQLHVIDLYIQHHGNAPDEDTSLVQLPALLASAERYGEVVDYLSAGRFAKLYQVTPSMKLVLQTADEGIRAAQTLNRSGDLVRFLLQKCSIAEIAASDVGVAELRAMTALNHYEDALALANGCTQIERRFKLLVAIARIRREQGLPEDPDLTGQVRTLYKQIDPAILEGHLVSVACDLFATSPELAIDLVSNLGGRDDENAMDWALVRLSIQAQLQNDDNSTQEYARTISKRIQDPAAKRLSTEAAVILGRYSATEALIEADQLGSTGDKLYVLQHWMKANRDRSDASMVFEAGIRLALQATTYSANAQVFRDLASCLPYITELHRLNYYLGLLDAQRPVLQRLGPEEDYFRLQLIMARAEWKQDQVAGAKRYVDVYNEICLAKDPLVRATAMARLSASIARTDELRILDDVEGLHTLADAELRERVAAILGISADHYDACKSVIRALAAARPQAALSIIEQLNTEWRRDEAYVDFIETAAAVPLHEFPTTAAVSALDSIQSRANYEQAIGSIVRAIRRRTPGSADIANIRPLLAYLRSVDSAAQRALWCAQVLGRLAETCEQEPGASADLRSEVTELADVIAEAWEVIDHDWEKLDVGFDIVVALSQSLPTLAHEYVAHVNTLKRQLLLLDARAAAVASLNLRLAIRAYYGLLLQRLDRDEDGLRLRRAIGQVGSIREQVDLFSELALRLYLAKRQEACQELVQETLIPLLLSVSESDIGTRNELVVLAAPALQVGAAGTARSLLERLPLTDRDDFLWRIALFILRKLPLSDPYESRTGIGYELSFEDVNQLVQVLDEMSQDSRIYSIIVAIADSVGDGNRDRLNRSQRAELARQLEELVAVKFPAARFIRHDGFAVVALAEINRIRDRDALKPMVELSARGRAVPNVTDRAYILGILASHARSAKERTSLLAEAKAIVDGMPMLADRIDLLYSMSRQLLDIDKRQSEDLLREAMKLAAGGQGDSLQERRQSLIELACRHFPELAAAWASATDDDPATRRVSRQLTLQNIASSLVVRRQPAVRPEVRDVFDWSRGAWLGLARLNAGRTSAARLENAIATLQHSSGQPLSRSYPLFAWFIENVVRLSASKRDAKSLLMALFESCLHGSELALLTSGRVEWARSRSLEVGDRLPESEQASRIYGERERDLGLQFIRDWLMDVQPEKLWIVEPYFGPESIGVLALVRDVAGDCDVILLAGRENSLRNVSAPANDAYCAAWERLREDEPPRCKLILAGGARTGAFPIHDRWWLAESSGLHIGTSYSGIGARASVMRRIDSTETCEALERFREYFAQSRREFNGERLTYMSLTL